MEGVPLKNLVDAFMDVRKRVNARVK